MKKISDYTFFLLALFIFFLAIFILYVLQKNISLLKTTISQDEVKQNNLNTKIEDTALFTNLQNKQVIVPAKFKNGAFATNKTLNLPEKFTIEVWASGIKTARGLDFTKGNNLVVTAKDSGEVYLIENKSAGKMYKIDSGLIVPHGIDYYNGDLYVAEMDKVVVYRNLTETGKYSKKETLVKNLPTGGHNTRTVVIGPDEKMYVSIGSSCNLCEEKDSRRAAIVRYNLDGTGEKIFASGLRNTVDFIFHKTNGVEKIWGVDNGRDLIGNDIPPEEVNIIEEGKHYGWPFCYGDGINNPEYSGKKDYCQKETQKPAYNMQAHSAPLGLTFVPEAFDQQKSILPEYFKNDLFITFHGSWNRTQPTGYKVVRIDSSSTKNKPINFITGWLNADGNFWGRPVGIRFDANSDMFITDDMNGVVYRVKYNE